LMFYSRVRRTGRKQNGAQMRKSTNEPEKFDQKEKKQRKQTIYPIL
jgi:hypothetical protein